MTQRTASPPAADPAALRTYWRDVHRWAQALPASDDPERLQAVCHPGAPELLNRYAAWCQRRAFARALEPLGTLAGSRALDVGCGNARWSRELRARGAEVVAVDISAEAIERNRRLVPDVAFVCADLGELEASASPALAPSSFDLAVSVTVVQHLPPAAQERAVGSIARLLVPGGTLVLLENLRDVGAHVFARSPQEWIELARQAGLRPVSARGYAFDLPLRAGRALSGGAAARATDLAPPTRVRQGRLRGALLAAATAAAYPTELVAAALLGPRHATHAAFVLRKASR